MFLSNRKAEARRIIARNLVGFHFYEKLDFSHRKKFINRVDAFAQTKNFRGESGLEVTDDMRVKVSIVAVALTFGLKNYFLRNYKVIILYPSKFYLRSHKAWATGVTAKSSFIALSWPDFLDGLNDQTDGYNLAFHEFAHALEFQLLSGASDFDKRFNLYYGTWVLQKSDVFRQLKNEPHRLIRNYGSNNQHEFFAVCVELFFEKPKDLLEESPQIYGSLCYLLNLDLLNVRNNFQFNSNQLKRYGIKNLQIKRLRPLISYGAIIAMASLGFVFGSIPFAYAIKYSNNSQILMILFVSIGLLGLILYKPLKIQNIIDVNTRIFMFWWLAFVCILVILMTFAIMKLVA